MVISLVSGFLLEYGGPVGDGSGTLLEDSAVLHKVVDCGIWALGVKASYIWAGRPWTNHFSSCKMEIFILATSHMVVRIK